MKQKICLLCLLLLLIPQYVFAMAENQLMQIQEETNRIVQSIESQKIDGQTANSFVYALLAIVAISMIFELFVRNYKREIYEKKDIKEPTKQIRIKLWITYGIHLTILTIFCMICRYLFNITNIYVWFLVVVSIYIVEIAPLFTIHFRKKRDKEEQA